MGADEVGTLKGLTERRAILDRIIGETQGSHSEQVEVDPMVRTTGSGFLGGTAAVRFSQ